MVESAYHFADPDLVEFAYHFADPDLVESAYNFADPDLVGSSYHFARFVQKNPGSESRFELNSFWKYIQKYLNGQKVFRLTNFTTAHGFRKMVIYICSPCIEINRNIIQ